jgi:hypothetical protein
MDAKFKAGDKAWLKSGDRPACEVIIVTRHDGSNGGYAYTLEYKSSKKRVENPRGDHRFPEAQLTNRKPTEW